MALWCSSLALTEAACLRALVVVLLGRLGGEVVVDGLEMSVAMGVRVELVRVVDRDEYVVRVEV